MPVSIGLCGSGKNIFELLLADKPWNLKIHNEKKKIHNEEQTACDYTSIS